MKKRFEKPKKETRIVKSPLQVARCDEYYRQINSVSFQQNFKDLIGHYKAKLPISKITLSLSTR